MDRTTSRMGKALRGRDLMTAQNRRGRYGSVVNASNAETYARFLNKLGRYSLLTAEQELILGRQVKEGQAETATPQQVRLGKRARSKLANCNLRLVVSLANAAHRKGTDIMDLIQCGCEGLLKACDRYDYTLGYKFSTYATWWIRQGIQRYGYGVLETIRIPSGARQQYLQVKKMTKDYNCRLHREPTHEEIFEETGISRARLEDLETAYCRQVFPLDSTFKNAREGKAAVSMADILICQDSRRASEETIWDSIPENGLETLIQHTKLKDIEKRVLASYFGLNGQRARTFSQIAAFDTGKKLSTEGIRQIHHGALKKLRRKAKEWRFDIAG